MKTVLCVMLFLGLTNTEEYKGCAKDGMVEFNFSCNNTMKRVFILNAYLTKKDCISTVQYPDDAVFEEEFTEEMKKTCNTRTECRAYKNWKDKLGRQGDFQYYVIFSCEWLFPKTPVIEVFRDEQSRNFGNQFVLKSQGYPNLFTASDFQCNISKHQDNTQVTVHLKDLPNDQGKFCIKSSVSSGCMQSGTSNFLNFKNHDSFTVQGTIHSGDASLKTKFSLIIQASISGSRLDTRPPDNKFEVRCRNASSKETIDRTPIATQPNLQTERTATGPLTRENMNGVRTTESLIILTTQSVIDQGQQVSMGSQEAISLAAIIGGIISGIVLVALGVGGFFLWRRRQIKRKNSGGSNTPDILASTRATSVGNDYVNPKPESKDLTYEHVNSSALHSRDPPGSSTSENSPISHVEVNGDMYALPGSVPKRPIERPDRAISAECEDDGLDMEVIDNSLYKFRN